MNGLSGVPTYTPETQKEQFEKNLINSWPKVYRFINGLFSSFVRMLRDGIVRAIQQIFH